MSHRRLEDPALPLLGDLLDPAATAELIAVALDRAVAGVRLVDVSYRPGRSVTVRCAVDLVEETDPATVVAIHGAEVPAGGLEVSDGAHQVAFWRFPDDPGLPGLRSLFEPAALVTLLAELGVADPAPRVVLRAYRPGRRAVVEITAGGVRLFAKAVRPRRVAELQALHAALAPRVPIPRSRGWHPVLGLVVMEAIPGSSLAATVAAGAGVVPSAGELVALLDLIAATPVSARPRPGPRQRASDHAATLRLLVPEAGATLERVLAVIDRTAPTDPITAHRDFHAGQLILDAGALRLVDVDTVGTGTRADDLATMIAQLVCLARPGPAAAPFGAYTRLLAGEFTALVGAEALYPRVAASLLGFALGPFRVQESAWPVETRRRIEAAGSAAAGELKF